MYEKIPTVINYYENCIRPFRYKRNALAEVLKFGAEPRSSAECSLNTTGIMQVEVCPMIFGIMLSTGGPLNRAVLCKGELHAVSKICVWLFSYNDQCLPAWVQIRVWRCAGKYGVKRLIPGKNKRSSTLTKNKLYFEWQNRSYLECFIYFERY